MANRLTIAALTLAASAGLSSTSAVAMEPVSVDAVMVYMNFSLDRRGDSGRAGRVGLRIGAEAYGDTFTVYDDPYFAGDSSFAHLDLRFLEREDGGLLINGASLQRRRDLPLAEQSSARRAAWAQ
jgi:hypothetical protein